MVIIIMTIINNMNKAIKCKDIVKLVWVLCEF